MIHQFKTKSHDLTGLFTDVNLMSTFVNRLQTQAEFDPLRYDVNDYLGDGFEFFVELFLNINSFLIVFNHMPNKHIHLFPNFHNMFFLHLHSCTHSPYTFPHFLLFAFPLPPLNSFINSFSSPFLLMALYL